MKMFLWMFASVAFASELRFVLHDEPKTMDPLVAADENAEALRFLTEGVLIRVNRSTQKPEAELATSWKISKDGKKITFTLRQGVKYPDGAPFTSEDVVETFHRLLEPTLHSPIADTFKSDKGSVSLHAEGTYTVVADFPEPAGGMERLFDQVSIVSHLAARRPAPGLGPFLIAEHEAGVSIVLKKNPSYWKRDGNSPLPRVDSIRISLQQNRDLELLRFQRGEIDLIDKISPDLFERLAQQMPAAAIDSGPTLESEFAWFNMASQSPIPEYKKQWFRSTEFRRAVSQSINRADLCRVVYRGHASPAAGPISPSNRKWFNENGKPDAFDPQAALRRLQSAGFSLQNGVLRDGAQHVVEFSIVTNAGSKTRERMAAMIQQDLAKVGMKVNIVTLDFPSLIERITRSLNYEASLLGLVNVDSDPSGLMNVLLSSAANHPWNPSQKQPETTWEAEIDRLMLAQSETADDRVRKKHFDRVQDILREQAPVIYLLHPNALSAVSPQVSGGKAAAFFPRTFWDAEHMTIRAKTASE